jgi:hypothetical protein
VAGVCHGVTGNVDRPVGSALQLPPPPGGKGSMTAGGLGVHPLFRRGGLLTTGVSSELRVSSELGVSSELRG